MSFWHGLRASEAIGLTPEHFAGAYLTLQRIGRSLRTAQPLVEDESELLDEKAAIEVWLERHKAQYSGDGRGRRLFPISRIQFFRLMRRYGRLAGLPQDLCHPHVLRRSAAMRLLRDGGIENARQHLGHRWIASTCLCLLGERSAAVEF